MSSTAALAALPSHVSPADRLGLTVFLAIVIHAIVILGVSFTPSDKPRINRDTMEIILVPTRTQKPPEKADYLAQASQDGGGESESKERPGAPLLAPLAAQEAVVVAAAPPVVPTEPVSAREAPEQVVLTRIEASKDQPSKPVRKTEPAPRQESTSKTDPLPKSAITNQLSAAALVSRSLEIASLSAEINRKLRAYAERPRHRFINARTKEYKYAAYMEAWRAKVERVGNLNYPDEARRRRLSGDLLLDVALRPDGSIHRILLRRSSGHTVLDDAALRIVKLAAPFAPFPKDIREETDILHVERTWQFLTSNRLVGK